MFGWGVQSPTPVSPHSEQPASMYTGSLPEGGDEITGLAMKVQRLQEQVSGLTNYGSSFSSLNNDVQQVVDRIGRELSAQRRSLDEINSKMESFKREVASIKDGKFFDQIYVSQTRFAEVYAELKLELKSVVMKSMDTSQMGSQNGNFSMAAMGQSISQAMTNAYAGNSMMTMSRNTGDADVLGMQRIVDGMRQEVTSVNAKVQDMSGRMNDVTAKVQDFNRNIQQCFGYLQDCSVKIQETNAKVFDVKLEFTGQLSEMAQRIGMPPSPQQPSGGPPAVVGVPPQEFERAIQTLEEKLTAVRMGQMGNEARLHEVASRSQVGDQQALALPHEVVSAKIKEATDALYQSIGSSDIVRSDMLKKIITEVREEFQRRFHEVVKEFKNDNAILNDCLEQNALKTAYLAIAATECTQEEKVQLFDSIKSKEREIAEKTGGEPGLANIAPHYPSSLSNIRTSVQDLMPNVMQTSAPAIYQQQPMQTTPAPVATNNVGMLPVTETLYIDRRPGKIGLSLDGSSGQFLLVQRVHDGLIYQWNGENPSQAIQPGDRIVAINGIARDPNRMIEETRKTEIPILTFTVERGSGMAPQGMQPSMTGASGMYPSSTQMTQMTVDSGPQPQMLNIKVFCMADEKLGLSLDCDDNKTLLVTDVKPGPVIQWNSRNPQQAVRPGDRIISVNGRGGSPQVLLEETGKGGNLDIQFSLAPMVH